MNASSPSLPLVLILPPFHPCLLSPSLTLRLSSFSLILCPFPHLSYPSFPSLPFHQPPLLSPPSPSLTFPHPSFPTLPFFHTLNLGFPFLPSPPFIPSSLTSPTSPSLTLPSYLLLAPPIPSPHPPPTSASLSPLPSVLHSLLPYLPSPHHLFPHPLLPSLTPPPSPIETHTTRTYFVTLQLRGREGGRWTLQRSARLGLAMGREMTVEISIGKGRGYRGVKGAGL